MLRALVGIEVSARQIQRVSKCYGQRVEEHLAALAKGTEAPPVLALKANDEVVYGLLDGSVIFSREKGWTEMKVGRLFASGSRVAVQPDRKENLRSLYVWHLGGHKTFLGKFDAYCEPYQHKVFIADGARWIWNWVEDAYPEAVQILDFYHALEKLGVYAGLQYPDEPDENSGWRRRNKPCSTAAWPNFLRN